MSPSALPIYTRRCLRLFALPLIASLGLLTACGDGADSSTGPGDDDSAEITTLQSSKARASAAATRPTSMHWSPATRSSPSVYTNHCAPNRTATCSILPTVSPSPWP